MTDSLTDIMDDDLTGNLTDFMADTLDDDLQIEVMKEFGERYPDMQILDWREIVKAYTPLVRAAAKKPSAKIIDMQQSSYLRAAEREEELN